MSAALPGGELSARAVAAAVAVAAAHGLRCAEPMLLADRTNVLSR